MARKALLAGATGMIGGQLLELLLAGDSYDEVITISRKPLTLLHPKLKNLVAEFADLDRLGDSLRADDIFCCLGTTIKIAKTKEAFRQVDYEYPLKLAVLCKALGATQYFLVSAVGADKTSTIFYSRVKGEIEEAIQTIGYPAYHILRPSMLLGPRSGKRAGEEAAKLVFRYLGFLIPKRYAGIESIRVARAMKVLALENKKGLFVYESEEFQNF